MVMKKKKCYWIIACNPPNFIQKQLVILGELSYSIVFLCSNKNRGEKSNFTGFIFMQARITIVIL